MINITDIKPSLVINNITPTLSVLDKKPSLGEVNGETTQYLAASVLGAGQPMGLLLALTYAVSMGTVQAQRR